MPTQPLNIKVRTLIQTYLTDEQQGSSSSRNPISSINEILRDGKFNRDRNKVYSLYTVYHWLLKLGFSLATFPVF
jgi:hypothetical protein